MAVERLPIVGVMGSGREPYAEKAVPLGRWLAGLRVHLLTGGGPGVMAAVSRAFVETPGRTGRAIGILPGAATPEGHRLPEGYPNPWVEIAIVTHLPETGERGTHPLSRNHLNVLSAHVVVALPGGPGTASEVALARRYGRPVAAWLGPGEAIPSLPAGVPVLERFEDVRRFVLDALGRGGEGAR